MTERIDSKAAFFIVGFGVGSLVAILFAPKSGDETREYLTQKAKEGSEYARMKAMELRDRAEKTVERGKEMIGETRDQFAAAIDAGRKSYHHEKLKAQLNQVQSVH